MHEGDAFGDSRVEATLDVREARVDESRELPRAAGNKPRALALADGGGAAEPLALLDAGGDEPRALTLALADGGGAGEPLKLIALQGADPLPEASTNNESVSRPVSFSTRCCGTENMSSKRCAPVRVCSACSTSPHMLPP